MKDETTNTAIKLNKTKVLRVLSKHTGSSPEIVALYVLLYTLTHGVIFLYIAAIVYYINTLNVLGSQMWEGQGQIL